MKDTDTKYEVTREDRAGFAQEIVRAEVAEIRRRYHMWGVQQPPIVRDMCAFFSTWDGLRPSLDAWRASHDLSALNVADRYLIERAEVRAQPAGDAE